MSTTFLGENSTINNIDTQYKDKKQIYMKYKNLDDDFNLISLKSRYTLQKINSLMEDMKDNADEEIDIDALEDPKNIEYKNKILQKKMIQYYCCNKNDKDSFLPPSEKVIKKIRQFKKWQNYEIFQNRGIKGYLDNLMPDHKIVHQTKKLLDDKINLYTKITVKSNNNNNANNNNNNSTITILPKITNYNCNNEKSKDKDNDLFMDRNQSVHNYKSNISNNNHYQSGLLRNSSMGEIFHKNYSISNINQNSFIFKKESKFNNLQS